MSENKSMQQLRGTSAALEAQNVTPLAGQLVFETDTGGVKIGDGITAYKGLPYIGLRTWPKEITESWQSLRTRIAAGDFNDILVGDYKPITLTTNEIVIMEVAGVDQYYKCGNPEIGHHIDFISRDCLAGSKRMKATNTNNGTEAEKNPWLAAELNQTLNDETTGVFATLPSDLKPYIITKRALIEERYSAEGAVPDDTGWSWADMGKLWLPTEVEVFGHHTWSEAGYGTGGGGCNRQYPIFQGDSKHLIKGDGNGGSRSTWWEMSVVRMNDTYFCRVSSHGIATSDNPSRAGVNAPLCFRIG